MNRLPLILTVSLSLCSILCIFCHSIGKVSKAHAGWCYAIQNQSQGVFHYSRLLLSVSSLSATDAALLIVLTGVESCNSHVLSVALGDLVSDGILVRQVFIVEKVLPALRLIKISNLSWCTERRKEAEMYLQIRMRGKILIHLIYTILIPANVGFIHNANEYISTCSTTVKNWYCDPNNS